MTDIQTDSYQDQRRLAIEEAAYAVLAEKGYKAASMLAIARRAKASNETLYNWYGNKQKLFGTLVEANTLRVRTLLDAQMGALGSKPIQKSLEELGAVLLEIVTGERAIALNRAAAGDVHDTGVLGATIAEAGKATLLPLIAELFKSAKKRGELSYAAKDQIEEVWVSLLIGDLQIQRVIGARAPLDDKIISARAKRAAALIVRLYGASNT